MDRPADTRPLRLKVVDGEDLAVASAQLQDAILPICDMAYLPEERRFVMVVNRFRWETAQGEGGRPYLRTNCGVRFENVTSVKVRDIDLADRSQILELLCMHAEPDGIHLHFAGHGVVKLEVERLSAVLDDLGQPWHAQCCPCHAFEEAAQSD